ncbi:hypothetical protein LUU34_00474200 [Aix galericulata]|nr:hypothetical protein LUU34_00474200 [Aix galericulata]
MVQEQAGTLQISPEQLLLCHSRGKAELQPTCSPFGRHSAQLPAQQSQTLLPEPPVLSQVEGEASEQKN